MFGSCAVTWARAHQLWLGAVLLSLPMATAVGWAAGTQAVLIQPSRGAASDDFRQRVDRYMALRETLQREGMPPAQTADVGPNRASQQALALRIRAARHDARQGEMFTPAVAAMLRTAMNAELRGTASAGTRASIRDDAPAPFTLQVNGGYPDGAPRPTVPGNVLAILPPLPDGLEYRVIDHHLILLDADADVVLDYLFNVMCASC